MANSTQGKIIWQTSMQMTDTGVVPALTDRFTSDRWEASQKNQGLIKYTQYINNGISAADGADDSISDLELVDFGWLKAPRYVCFSNYTPEGKSPTSIFIGCDNKKSRESVHNGTAELDKPLWWFGMLSSEAFATYSETLGDWTLTEAQSFSAASGCRECFEVPPGTTIGPIIIPEGIEYWAYLAEYGDSVLEDGTETEYAAILVTEAYDA